jgi:hypothetical protein
MANLSNAGFIVCAALAFVAGCDKGSAPAGAVEGSKTCPDGAPLCVNLPSGHTLGDPRSGAWGSNITVFAPDKSQVAVLFWLKPEEFDTRIASKVPSVKTAKGKDEQLLGGKGRYLEWDATDPKEDHHFVEIYVKTDKNTLQCSGFTPKGNAAKIAMLQGVCRSMVAK